MYLWLSGVKAHATAFRNVQFTTSPVNSFHISSALLISGSYDIQIKKRINIPSLFPNLVEVFFNARACDENWHFKSGNFWHNKISDNKINLITFIWLKFKDMWFYFLRFMLDIKGSWMHARLKNWCWSFGFSGACRSAGKVALNSGFVVILFETYNWAPTD